MTTLPDILAALRAGGNFEQPHPCIHPGCRHTVPYDDEPYCFTHSPDSGSYLPGYSYAESQRGKAGA